MFIKHSEQFLMRRAVIVAKPVEVCTQLDLTLVCGVVKAEHQVHPACRVLVERNLCGCFYAVETTGVVFAVVKLSGQELDIHVGVGEQVRQVDVDSGTHFILQVRLGGAQLEMNTAHSVVCIDVLLRGSEGRL